MFWWEEGVYPPMLVPLHMMNDLVEREILPPQKKIPIGERSVHVVREQDALNAG